VLLVVDNTALRRIDTRRLIIGGSLASVDITREVTGREGGSAA
jgi:hypothetical protein